MVRPEVNYDEAANAAYIRFSSEDVADSSEVSPGIVFDYDGSGKIVGMELLDAKKQLPASLLAHAA